MALADMPSKISLWMRWAKAMTKQADPRRERIVSRFSTALLVFERDSQQVRRMIGHGSRKRGTKKWSKNMELIGRHSLRNGCRTCWMTRVVTHSQSLCITRRVACSMARRRCKCQGVDRSRGLPRGQPGCSTRLAVIKDLQ